MEVLDRSSLDLVFMDCEMPEMDGLTTTMAIRQRCITRSDGWAIQIGALTAHALDTHRVACAAACMDDHVSKPMTLIQIFQSLTRWPPSVAFRAA